MIQLSKRLRTIASYIQEETIHFADIGSDHALLPCAICLEDEKKYAIASDVREGPLNSAKQTIQRYNLSERVTTRLGSGLSVLEKNEVSDVIISGMGGTLISEIMEEGRAVLLTIDRLIIQPNIDEIDVREKLSELCFSIVDEEIVEDRGHYYEVIVAEKTNTAQELSDKDLFFGPILRKKRPEILIDKYKHKQIKLLSIIQNMERNGQENKKKQVFARQLQWIEEFLNHDNE